MEISRLDKNNSLLDFTRTGSLLPEGYSKIGERPKERSTPSHEELYSLWKSYGNVEKIKGETLETGRKTARLSFMYKLSHELTDIKAENYLKPNSERRTRDSH